MSREHHQGLLFCLRIHTGLQKQVSPERIRAYVLWFWEHHLKPHFQIEEEYVFPILESTDELLIRALDEHRRLEALVFQEHDPVQTLATLEDTLYHHIRFEERVLFNKIQDIASPEQLEHIHLHHEDETLCAPWHDPFWKTAEKETH